MSRILIALDSSSVSGTLLGIASELSLKSDADLEAIYIEDANWFEASQFSFTYQVSSYTGELIPFSEQHIMEQSRALDRRLQSMCTHICGLMNIRYSYRSARGVVANELLAAASQVDLVVIGRSRQAARHKTKLGSTARKLAESNAGPVLLWNSGQRWPDSFVGICSTPQQSESVIEWTLTLAEVIGRKTSLLWPAASISSSDEWDRKWSTDTWPISIPMEEVRSVSEIHSDLSADILRHYKNQLLVFSRSNLAQSPDLLERLTNSILLL